MLVPRLHPSESTTCCNLHQEATRALDRCSNRRVNHRYRYHRPRHARKFEEVIDDEEEVPVEEPAAPEAAAEEEVPAAPEAIPDAARHRLLQRCMAFENLKTP